MHANAPVPCGRLRVVRFSYVDFDGQAQDDGEIMVLDAVAPPGASHHLGTADAKKFINNTMTTEHAQYLLENQVGKSGAAVKAEKFGDDYLEAHRNWLKGFIDDRTKLVDYMCDPSVSETVRDLIPITEAIRGK